MAPQKSSSMSDSERNKAYYAANAERLKARRREYYALHRKDELARGAEYRRANQDKIRDYFEANKEWRYRWVAQYQKKKMAADPVFRIYAWVLRRMNEALAKHRAGRNVTNQSRIVQYMGCEWLDFMAHIERQFLPGMTWDNHGRSGWHFDHIRPLRSFDLTDDEQLRKACNFTNVQPLWAADNVKKGNKIA